MKLISIFLSLMVAISIYIIYLEIKNKEGRDKIFYSFYMFGTFVFIMPFLQIFDSWVAYTIFLLLYTFLLYSLYTDFKAFSLFSEFFLSLKNIKKEEFTKVDTEFLQIIKDYYKSTIKTFSLKVYSLMENMIDYIFILGGIILAIVLAFSFISKF